MKRNPNCLFNRFFGSISVFSGIYWSRRSYLQVVDALQNLYEDLLRDFPKDQELGRNWREMSSTSSLLFVDAVDLPDVTENTFFDQLRRVQTTLSTREALLDVPRNLEAKRRISFFSNSLFMTMPRAPQVFSLLVLLMSSSFTQCCYNALPYFILQYFSCDYMSGSVSLFLFGTNFFWRYLRCLSYRQFWILWVMSRSSYIIYVYWG